MMDHQSPGNSSFSCDEDAEDKQDGRITVGALIFLLLSTSFISVTSVYSTLSVRPTWYQCFVGVTSLVALLAWYLLVIATTPRYILVSKDGIFFIRLFGIRLESIECASDATLNVITETLIGGRKAPSNAQDGFGIQIHPCKAWHINVVRGFITNRETLITKAKEFLEVQEQK